MAGSLLVAGAAGERNSCVDGALVQIADGRTLECPTESTVFSASFTNDGCQCVVGTWKGDVLVFAPDGQAIATLSGHTARVADVVAHPTDPQVVLTYGDDGTLRVWHLGLLREVTTLRPFATCNIRTAGFSDGGNAIAAVGTDGSLVSYSITFADRIIEQAKGVRESGESIE